MHTNNNLPRRIREIQRENERDVLQFLRERIKYHTPVCIVSLFRPAWIHALERLQDAGKVKIHKTKWNAYYMPVRNARPVTNAR